jgi:hypothetical protein
VFVDNRAEAVDGGVDPATALNGVIDLAVARGMARGTAG